MAETLKNHTLCYLYDANGQLPVVKLLLEMTAKPVISGHIGFSNCHSL
ncbi:MAG: hypothetical protein ACI96N_002735, partial [Arenicella sp.]